MSLSHKSPLQQLYRFIHFNILKVGPHILFLERENQNPQKPLTGISWQNQTGIMNLLYPMFRFMCWKYMQISAYLL